MCGTTIIPDASEVVICRGREDFGYVISVNYNRDEARIGFIANSYEVCHGHEPKIEVRNLPFSAIDELVIDAIGLDAFKEAVFSQLAKNGEI